MNPAAPRFTSRPSNHSPLPLPTRRRTPSKSPATAHGSSAGVLTAARSSTSASTTGSTPYPSKRRSNSASPRALQIPGTSQYDTSSDFQFDVAPDGQHFIMSTTVSMTLAKLHRRRKLARAASDPSHRPRDRRSSYARVPVARPWAIQPRAVTETAARIALQRAPNAQPSCLPGLRLHAPPVDASSWG
jgi:hypothetical protein